MGNTKKAMLGLWEFSRHPLGDSIWEATVQVQKL